MGNSIYVAAEPVMTPTLHALGDPDPHTTLCPLPEGDASVPVLDLLPTRAVFDLLTLHVEDEATPFSLGQR